MCVFVCVSVFVSTPHPTPPSLVYRCPSLRQLAVRQKMKDKLGSGDQNYKSSGRFEQLKRRAPAWCFVIQQNVVL